MYDLQLLRYAADQTRSTDGSRPGTTPTASKTQHRIEVKGFRAASPSFWSSLYRNISTGHYHIIFAGKNELSAPLLAKGVMEVREVAALWGTFIGQWHVEMSDALWFSFKAFKQIRDELRPQLGREPSLEDIRPVVNVIGHSIGGALAELVSQFFGLKGFNIDGPGMQGLTQHSEFVSMKELVRHEFADLQSRYQFEPGDFVAHGFSVVGIANSHAIGVTYEGPLELDEFARIFTSGIGEGEDA